MFKSNWGVKGLARHPLPLRIRWLFMPGESLARRFDEGYAGFVNGIKRRIERGDRRLVLYSCLAYAEHILPFVVGAMASSLASLSWASGALPLPLIALGDPHVWKKRGFSQRTWMLMMETLIT